MFFGKKKKNSSPRVSHIPLHLLAIGKQAGTVRKNACTLSRAHRSFRAYRAANLKVEGREKE
jgi:hypothetical protein